MNNVKVELHIKNNENVKAIRDLDTAIMNFYDKQVYSKYFKLA